MRSIEARAFREEPAQKKPRRARGGGASPNPSPVEDSCAGAAATSQKATEKQNP